MPKPPFTLTDIEAMPIIQLGAIDDYAIAQAAATIPSLEREELEDLVAALKLLMDHKQFAAEDAHNDGEVELARHLASAANARRTLWSATGERLVAVASIRRILPTSRTQARSVRVSRF